MLSQKFERTFQTLLVFRILDIKNFKIFRTKSLSLFFLILLYNGSNLPPFPIFNLVSRRCTLFFLSKSDIYDSPATKAHNEYKRGKRPWEWCCSTFCLIQKSRCSEKLGPLEINFYIFFLGKL